MLIVFTKLQIHLGSFFVSLYVGLQVMLDFTMQIHLQMKLQKKNHITMECITDHFIHAYEYIYMTI